MIDIHAFFLLSFVKNASFARETIDASRACPVLSVMVYGCLDCHTSSCENKIRKTRPDQQTLLVAYCPSSAFVFNVQCSVQGATDGAHKSNPETRS